MTRFDECSTDVEEEGVEVCNAERAVSTSNVFLFACCVSNYFVPPLFGQQQGCTSGA